VELEKKVTTNGHTKGSSVSHNRRSEVGKANGTRNKINEEEYDREIAKIRIHLDLLMDLLKRSDEDQICGWTMRKKVKWHRLQIKRRIG